MNALEILYQDEHLVAVNKPSGMLVHPGAADDDGPVAMKCVRDLVGRWVYPIHRLDRGTSGVLLLALSSQVAAQVSAQFAGREVTKCYLALVRGVPPAEGSIDYFLPNKEDGPRVEALTTYRRLGTAGQFALMEATPHTGRPHQIRRHFQLVSHPLVGDARYGEALINRMFADRHGLNRIALHAAHLSFVHPVGGATLSVDAAVPGDLGAPLRSLGLAW